MLMSELIENRSHDLTGGTPVGVKVDHHRDVRLAYHMLKIIVAHPDRPIEQHRFATTAAFGTVVDLADVNTVERQAELTAHRDPTRRFPCLLYHAFPSCAPSPLALESAR